MDTPIVRRAKRIIRFVVTDSLRSPLTWFMLGHLSHDHTTEIDVLVLVLGAGVVVSVLVSIGMRWRATRVLSTTE